LSLKQTEKKAVEYLEGKEKHTFSALTAEWVASSNNFLQSKGKRSISITRYQYKNY